MIGCCLATVLCRADVECFDENFMTGTNTARTFDTRVDLFPMFFLHANHSVKSLIVIIEYKKAVLLNFRSVLASASLDLLGDLGYVLKICVRKSTKKPR